MVTAEQIVSNEIENTRRFVELLDNQPQKYLDIAAIKGCMYLLDRMLLTSSLKESG